jgi:glycosyltransferase involved in cell wall biosynthesis
MKPKISNINIAVLAGYSFPYGGAATNRILAYCRGLIENAVNVDIFIPMPSDRLPAKEELPNNGSYDGIQYFYTTGRYRSKYLLIRGLVTITKFRQYYGYLTSWQTIREQAKNKKYSCIIISADLIPSLFIYSFLAKTIDAKSVFIFDEFPIPIRHKMKNSIPKWKSYLYSIVLKKIDAYVSISEKLKIYYCKFASKPTLVLPVIVDISRFPSPISNNLLKAKKYLCYMGNMELSKDDVDNIIKAFEIIVKKNKDLELHLYGNHNPQTNDYLRQLILSLALNDCAYLKGRVESSEVPKILCNAFILVSSQPNTIRASGGFPTKLGEYLLTGVPALLTDVGENAKYVKDGKHVFFVKPQDPTAYAEKLQYIIDNYEAAVKVAENGKEFILEHYSHVQQGKRLADFLRTLNV